MTGQQVRIFISSDGQEQVSQLFDTTPENALMHLQNIFKDKELVEQATTKDFLVVRQEGITLWRS